MWPCGRAAGVGSRGWQLAHSVLAIDTHTSSPTHPPTRPYPGVDLGSLQVGQLLLIPPFDDRCKEAAAPAEAPAPAKDKKQKKGGKKEQ